jgi:hypothetical protein
MAFLDISELSSELYSSLDQDWLLSDFRNAAMLFLGP